ncbi:MAG: head GIN domain-containing protein [Vitreoscilla sp.]
MRHALTLPLAAAATLIALQAQAAEQTRSVAPFTAVSNSGPVNLRIEVGKAQSVVVSGTDDLVQDLQTEVVGSELKLHMRRDTTTFNRHHDELNVTITVPQLTAFTMSGAGETTITHMSGDSLDVRFGGAGSLKADGSVRNLTMHVGGVGSIDTRELHAESATVNVGGVGSVKVWASNRLDASLGGVGSLAYYGDPKTVNTSGGGLGSISRGK